MDVFDSHHFRLNKSFLTLLGQWPFQSARIRLISLMTIFVVGGTNLLAKICATIRSRNDLETVMEDLTPINADLMAVLKLVNNAIKIDQLRELLERVQEHYASITTEGERKIMHKYAEGGRIFTIIYAGIFLMIMVVFIFPTLMPILTNNGTDRPFVHHTEFFVDPLEYYVIINVQSYVTIILVAYTVVSMDTMFVILVQHVCGLYTALGHRIRDLADQDEKLVDLYLPKENDESFKNISICIRRHQEAIEFSNRLESYYSTTFFLQVAVNTYGLAITGSRVVMMSESDQFVQHCSGACSAFAHIFFECINGQRLIDHSSRIHEYLTEAKWYQASIRTRKVMNLMIARSQYPCTLTAAGMLVMSMDTFSAVLRTAMSYFTVIRSTQ